MNQPRYTLIIEWSQEDACYVVRLPDWPSTGNRPVAEGATYDEAFHRGLNALNHFIEYFQEDGKPLPAPGNAA